MLFDLVRPLGARAGEREVNVLTTRPLGAGATGWAPELEYVYADGQSVELELPFDDQRLTQVKTALQGTFGTGADGHAIYGWQYIGLYDRDRDTVEQSLLYIAGYRFNPHWSTLGMAGLQQVGFRDLGPTYLLLNHSTFYNLDEAAVVGLELNLRHGLAADDTTRLRVIPQMLLRVTPVTSLQFGLGAEFLTGREAGLFGVLRVIRDF